MTVDFAMTVVGGRSRLEYQVHKLQSNQINCRGF